MSKEHFQVTAHENIPMVPVLAYCTGVLYWGTVLGYCTGDCIRILFFYIPLAADNASRKSIGELSEAH